MKMPKPRKRGDTYRIEFMYNGERYSCTRDTAKECERWVASKLIELRAMSDDSIKHTITIQQLFNLYYEKVGCKTPSARYLRDKLKSLDKVLGRLAVTQIHEISPLNLTAWRNKRLQEVSAGTVLKEISVFSSLFSYAQKELFLIEVNPFMGISKPSTPAARNRRITDDEIELIKEAFDYKEIKTPKETKHYVAWAFLFAIETAMRRGEILNIVRSDVHDNYIHIPKSKNGTKRDVPLSAIAKQLIDVIEFENDKAIPRTENAFRISWERKKKEIGLSDLHFHDTRHEAITRMVNNRNLAVETLAKITGHKKIEVLVNTYYNPSADEIVEMFNR